MAITTQESETPITEHPIATRSEWISARQELLDQEKEFTRLRDEISRRRRALPWVRVEKDYVFETPSGEATLADLFDGRSQLIVYHFMFGPDWDAGCSGCSFISDHIDGANLHLPHHDVSLVAVSRGRLDDLEAYRQRMGWKFRWVSSLESDFNYDYGVSYRREDLDAGEVFHNYTMQKLRGEEQPGLSVFYKNEDGEIFHTYSSYERGGDILIGAYNYLDLTPKGRNEAHGMDWMRRHDEYDA